MSIFTGSGVAIVTPFLPDGSVNYDKLDELIEYHIDHKTDAIIICGTTGESSTLTEEEHMECIKFTIQQVKKRVPVIAGTGSNATFTTIEMSREAVEYGADALLLVTPYYNKATQKGLVAHYKAVADEAKAPIILYSVASRTGLNIAPETAAELAKIDNIVAIKEASGNISQIAKIMQLTDGKLDLYSGNDDQIVPLLSLGGKGVISVLANIAPEYTHDICRKFFDGDLKGSLKMQLDALPLIDKLFCEVNPIPVKTAMNLLGKEVGGLRMPLSPMEEAHKQALAEEMKKFGMNWLNRIRKRKEGAERRPLWICERRRAKMVRIIMHGCNGKMGQVITRLAAEDGNCQIVAGIDTFRGIENTYPVFDNLKDCDVGS